MLYVTAGCLLAMVGLSFKTSVKEPSDIVEMPEEGGLYGVDRIESNEVPYTYAVERNVSNMSNVSVRTPTNFEVHVMDFKKSIEK